tara:strand:+ start:2379 stop:3629 length:1251 start_codon:yes stop_codon:yes gene_type:complete
MLGLYSGIQYQDAIGATTQPIDIDGLVAWWDFTDKSSMYTDAGSTNVSSNNDKIYRVDNKAYTLQNNNTSALGKYLEQEVEAKRPTHIVGTGAPWYHAPFYNNEFPHAKFYQDVPNDIAQYLYAYRNGAGKMSDGVLSATTKSMSSFTQFFVYRSKQRYLNKKQYMFGMWGYDLDTTSFFGPFATQSQMNFQSDYGFDVGNSNVNLRQPYTRLTLQNKVWNNTLKQWFSFIENGHPTDSMNATEMNKFQFWTVKVNGTQTSSSSAPYLRGGRLYKNGNRTIGIDENTFTSYDDDGDCGIGDNNCFANTIGGGATPAENLNNGIPIPMEPSHVTIGTNPTAPNAYSGSWSNEDGHIAGQQSLFDTEVYEVIYYDRALTNNETLQVEEYLKVKYGTRKSYDDNWCITGFNCPGDPYGP